MSEYLFASESVSEGHPDKICDRVSDAVLDFHLKLDPEARTAIECLVTTKRLLLAGEVRTRANVMPEEVSAVARRAIQSLGYEQDNFHWRDVQITNLIHEQSPNLVQGIGEGAGDQGLMFGFACDETEVLMPAPIYYSHMILRRLKAQISSARASGLGPDAKSQVSLVYDEATRMPKGIDSIVVSVQHARAMKGSRVEAIIRALIDEVFPKNWVCPAERLYVNPAGRFEIGGPDGDAGLTGRKIIVDTYGGGAPHGGGAFSGKDPSKVDRSAAYAARYLAKNVVAAGLARRCLIQIAYAIGREAPVAFQVSLEEKRTKRSDGEVGEVLREKMNLTPRGIKTHLALTRPIYQPTSCYGHFGRAPRSDGAFSWEKTNLAEDLKSALA